VSIAMTTLVEKHPDHVTCVQMYFNSTLTDSSKLLKPLLVFSFVICAIICGLTRIIQYKNHAIDVYLGFLLGGSIAVYLVGGRPTGSPVPSSVVQWFIVVSSGAQWCLMVPSGVQCGAVVYSGV